MKTLLTAAFLFFCIALSIVSFAQNEFKQHIKAEIIHFKGGGKLHGKILNIEGDTITFEMLTGEVIKLNSGIVKKVIQKFDKEGVAKLKFHQNKPYQFKEKGIYNTTYINLPQGRIIESFEVPPNTYYDRYWVLGLGIHHVTGMQYNRWLGTGVGLGFDGYLMGNGRNFFSIYGECRGYFLAQKISPYYSVGLGYGFGISNEYIGVRDNKGGLFFNPSLGYRFGGSAGANFTLGFGYKLQLATITDQSRNGSITVQEYKFNRLNTSFGILF